MRRLAGGHQTHNAAWKEQRDEHEERAEALSHTSGSAAVKNVFA